MSTCDLLRWPCVAALLWMVCGVLPAQQGKTSSGPLQFDQLFEGADFSSGRTAEPDPRVTATLAGEGEVVTLTVKLDLPEGGNTYSQDPSFAKPTRINVQTAAGLAPLDDQFTPDHPPKREYDENFRKVVEKYFGTVSWSRRYRLLEGADRSRVSASGVIEFLYCRESCRPLELTFQTALGVPAATDPPPTEPRRSPAGVDELAPPPVEEVAPPSERAAGPLAQGYRVVPQYPPTYHAAGDPAVVEFLLDERPGSEEVVLAVTLRLGPKYHVYALQPAPGQVTLPTTIAVTQVEGLQAVSGEFAPLTPPVERVQDLGTEVLRSLEHDGTVTWTQVFRRQSGAAAGVQGTITFQICDDRICLSPKTVEFSLGSLQSAGHVAEAEGISALLPDEQRRQALGSGGARGEPSSAAPPPAAVQIAFEDEYQSTTLGAWLVFAFLGGLLLNVMPCVLPVISIKILSFVHQAGEHPGRIMLLNAVYALGVLSVFVALAVLAITLKLGWGDQYQSAAYNMVMIGIVFVMGLSLLGVFEIPIPGMLSSGIGGQHQREGLLGAFLTGIIATLLATPCTGPFMGAALSWALKQPNHIILAIFGMMGLGMASPYLVIGWFPKLIDWLPRPGQWMVTFKQFCGFVLMGTAVWLLNTLHGINTELVIPTLVMLVGLGVLTWMLGQLYDLSSSARRKWTVRALALLLAGPILFGGGRWAYSVLSPPDQTVQVEREELPWQPFSEQTFQELIAAGKPVLVDFTAAYCMICKANERLALNTRATAEFVREHGFVPLVADFTRGDEEIRRWLEFFNNPAVPLTVIVPAGNPGKTKLLRSAYTQSTLLEVLKEAVEEARSAPAEATVEAPSGQTASLK